MIKVVQENKSISIFCPNCGTKINNCESKEINGDMHNFIKAYIECTNCIKKSIVRIKK